MWHDVKKKIPSDVPVEGPSKGLRRLLRPSSHGEAVAASHITRTGQSLVDTDILTQFGQTVGEEACLQTEAD